MTKAQLARELGVSRSYITLLSQGKKKPSREMANRLTEMGLSVSLSELSQEKQSTHNGPLAQLVEHLTFNQGVGSSSLPRPTIQVLQLRWRLAGGGSRKSALHPPTIQ